MKIEKEIREDHQAKLSVEVEGERLEEMKRRAAAKIARKIKLPGFRPGKAPYAVILRQVGDAAVLEEAIEMLVEEIYPQVIKEAEISAYGPGQLEGMPSADPLVLEFVVPLEPEVTLGDYRAIQETYELEPVTDEDVSRVLEDLRNRNAVIEPVERPAKPGDQVSVLLSARKLNMEEGEDDNLIRERSYPIIISQSEDPEDEDWPFPGFSRNLIDMTVGEEKLLTHTYAEDSEYEVLQGVTAEFKLHVEAVKGRNLPELDDDLAKTVGEFETLDALRQNILESLEHEKQEAYNDQYDEQILTKAVESTEYKYPPQMLEREVDNVLENLEHRLSHQNATIDLYLKSRNIEMSELREEMKPVAEKRLKRSLFLMNFGKAENIQVKPGELEKEAISTLNYLAQSLSEKEAKRLADREVQSSIVGNVLADLLATKAMNKFRNFARGIADEEEETTAESEVSQAMEADVQAEKVIEPEKPDVKEAEEPVAADEVVVDETQPLSE